MMTDPKPYDREEVLQEVSLEQWVAELPRHHRAAHEYRVLVTKAAVATQRRGFDALLSAAQWLLSELPPLSAIDDAIVRRAYIALSTAIRACEEE